MNKRIVLLFLSLCFITSSLAIDKKEFDTIITVKGLVCSSCGIGLKNKFKRHFLVKKLFIEMAGIGLRGKPREMPSETEGV